MNALGMMVTIKKTAMYRFIFFSLSALMKSTIGKR
jgi:hypothetical protein